MSSVYLENFDPKGYLNFFFTSTQATQDDLDRNWSFEFYKEQLFKFYTKYKSKWNNKTARLLEFGGGPSIMPLIVAAPYVSEIIFSAYLESERKEVELWKNKKESAHDWSSHFKSVVNQMERIAGDDAWREREELLRKRMSSIIGCDIFCENPLLVKQDPFEIISTSFCLDSACTTQAEYKKGVKKLVGLLKPGGFLLLCTSECGTFCIIEEKKFPSLYITLEQVKEALSEAGTAIITVERDPFPMEEIQNPIISDSKAILFLVAQKVVF